MDNIDKMPAGREMDALVAEKAMGYRFHQEPYDNRLFGSVKGLLGWVSINPDGTEAFGETKTGFRDYSTDTGAAFEVVEKVKDRFKDAQFAVVYRAAYDDPQKWIAGWRTERTYASGQFFLWDWSEIFGYAEADTAALAICRAVLKALDRP